MLACAGRCWLQQWRLHASARLAVVWGHGSLEGSPASTKDSWHNSLPPLPHAPCSACAVTICREKCVDTKTDVSECAPPSVGCRQHAGRGRLYPACTDGPAVPSWHCPAPSQVSLASDHPPPCPGCVAACCRCKTAGGDRWRWTRPSPQLQPSTPAPTPPPSTVPPSARPPAQTAPASARQVRLLGVVPSAAACHPPARRGARRK